MSTSKLSAGDKFPKIEVKTLAGETITLGEAKNGASWQMIVVYRGKHCPLCTKYLSKISEMKDDFSKAGVEIVAVSADTEEKAILQTKDKLGLTFDIGYDLSV